MLEVKRCWGFQIRVVFSQRNAANASKIKKDWIIGKGRDISFSANGKPGMYTGGLDKDGN